MAASLPQTDVIRLRAALGSWMWWNPSPKCAPRIESLLHNSGRNLSYLVRAQEQYWVLRIALQPPATLGVDSQQELRCLALAAAAGLAPTPAFADPEQGVLVCPYLRSDVGVSREESLHGAALLLRQLHALRDSGPSLNLRRRWLHYAGRAEVAPAMLARLSQLEESVEQVCLCHNDLLSNNRLRQQGTWYALDFEYAAWGDPCFDLAVVIEGDTLNTAEVSLLLSTYCRDQRSIETLRCRVEAWRELYRYTATLWQNATERAGLNRGKS